ncbi:MAG TPA: site-specific integrase [Opitutaceae bacterium]|nr:site-specific integrase [Opitutaceae bacterium]
MDPEETAAPGGMGELARIFRARTAADPDLRPATRQARLGALRRLLRTWPGIEARRPAEIAPAEVFAWAARFKAEGTGFRPPGARSARRGNSATSVNSAIDVLRALLDLAVERGEIRDNPVRLRRGPLGGRLKKRAPRRALIPPSRAQLAALFAAMERNGAVGGRGAEAADFCRFLAMSGARVGEAGRLTWGLVLWDRGLVHLPGYKSESSARFVPLFPELGALLRRIRGRRRSAARFRPGRRDFLGPEDPVFHLRECQRTIDSACRRTGVPRLTHHDFRHLFATACIESGVDVPTVSRWLGHADGGVLAMKTYGHFRPDHSSLAAQKVRFAASGPDGAAGVSAPPPPGWDPAAAPAPARAPRPGPGRAGRAPRRD